MNNQATNFLSNFATSRRSTMANWVKHARPYNEHTNRDYKADTVEKVMYCLNTRFTANPTVELMKLLLAIEHNPIDAQNAIDYWGINNSERPKIDLSNQPPTQKQLDLIARKGGDISLVKNRLTAVKVIAAIIQENL